jgi:hypothetical protein
MNIFLTWVKSTFQEQGYDFYGNMKLFDQADRTEIEFGLKRVFDYDVFKINQAIAAQVLCNFMFWYILYADNFREF